MSTSASKVTQAAAQTLRWPENHAWINDGGWVRLGYFTTGGADWRSARSLAHNGNVTFYNGAWIYTDNNGMYPVTLTPSDDVDPGQAKAWGLGGATGGGQRPAQHPPAQQHPATTSSRGTPSAPQRQAQRQSQRGGRAPAGPAGWYVAGHPPHAYSSRTHKDLGLIVGDGKQTVMPTNGGRLWALYDLLADGTTRYVNTYGSVPGAPPPPNAEANRVPQQFYPPPAPPPPPPDAGYYGDPGYAYPQYAQPAVPYYAPPQVAYAPQPILPAPQVQIAYAPQSILPAPPVQVSYASQVQPAVDPTTGVSLAGAPYGVDPVTGQPLTYAQSQWYAQYGVQSVSQQIAEGQQASEITASFGGDFGGYGLGGQGGIDPSEIALLTGGDSDLALQLAVANGGYDPTAGGMLSPY
jgi:hypothetical protein